MITIKQILVPTDFSETAEVALRYGKAFAETFQATLHVLYVLDDPMIGIKLPDHVCPIPAVRQEMETEAADHMAKVLTEAERAKYRAELVTLWGSPYLEIINYAKSHNIDLIVMGTYGRGFVEHMLIGSVAEKVVRKATCPVLTVRHNEHEFVMPDTRREESAKI